MIQDPMNRVREANLYWATSPNAFDFLANGLASVDNIRVVIVFYNVNGLVNDRIKSVSTEGVKWGI